jgi:hypothetical protein
MPQFPLLSKAGSLAMLLAMRPRNSCLIRMPSGTIGHSSRDPIEGMGGYHAANEEVPKSKAAGMRRAVIERRRVVVVAGERRIRGNRGARSGYADAEHHSEQRNHFRRRGNR